MSEQQENSTILPFDALIQYHILHMMIKRETFLIKCLTYLKEEHFTNPILGWFFTTICKHYETYQKTIELESLKNEVLKIVPEKRPNYDIVFEKIEASDYSDIDYLLNNLTDWVKKQEFVQVHSKTTLMFNAGKRDEVYGYLSGELQRINKISFVEDNIINWDNIDNLITEIRQPGYFISTGIPPIDDALLGGFARQSLAVYIGGTNVGKTNVLINVAYHMIRNGKKVLFIYHEGMDNDLTFRVLSRFTGIPYWKFYRPDYIFTPEEREIKQYVQEILKQKMIFKPWHTFNGLIEDVILYARHKKTEFDFDVIIDDYAQLLYTKNQQKEVRHNQAAVYRGLSTLAAELDVVAISAAQTNKESQKASEKGKIVTMLDIGECTEIARCATYVITLTQTPEDYVNNRMKFFLGKQRGGKAKNILVECTTDPNRLVSFDAQLGMVQQRISELDEVKNEEGNRLIELGSFDQNIPY